MHKIKVLDKTSNQIIKTFNLEEQNLAFQLAQEMESMGIEVEILSPTIVETLADSILSTQQKNQYLSSAQEEIDDHEGHE